MCALRAALSQLMTSPCCGGTTSLMRYLLIIKLLTSHILSPPKHFLHLPHGFGQEIAFSSDYHKIPLRLHSLSLTLFDTVS